MKSTLLSPDQLKLLYRGNFTYKQAALYLAIGVPKVSTLVESGELGIVIIDGKKYISRQECDRYLFENTRYRKKIGI